MNINNLKELLSELFDHPCNEGSEDAYQVWGYLGDQTVSDGPAHSWEVRKTVSERSLII